MSTKIRYFKKNYIKAIQEGYAAVFGGAGLSRASGYVDWKELLRDIASEINLDVDREVDLVEVAQFHCNETRGRATINNKILNRFVSDSEENEVLDILSDMPISTYWTTNYDRLIEDTMKKKKKKVDVKVTSNSLANTLENRDVIIHKMHGDYEDPSTCVITKDDYEMYNESRKLFSTSLQGDLVSKTFLFIGFSFEDPNLKYILSRIRNLLDENCRSHYCFLRKISKEKYLNYEDFEYDLNRQRLQINDLKRYGISVILLDSYDEIPIILKEIRRAIRNNTVFISGAAHNYGEFGENEGINLVRSIAQGLYDNSFRLVTGHARGIGSYIISTILEKTNSNASLLEKHLLIRAFPYEDSTRDDYLDMKYNYRNNIFKEAGIAIFIFGNKLVDNDVVLAKGMLEEFEIAKKNDSYIIPIGSTGFMAKHIFENIKQDIYQYPYLIDELEILENSNNVNELLESVIRILRHIQNVS